MSRVTRTKTSKVRIYLQEFPNETLSNDRKVLSCQSSEKSVSKGQLGQVIQVGRRHKKIETENLNFNNILFLLYIYIY